MEPYLIYTDSAADLPQSAYSEFDIRIIPMDYMLDGESVTFYTDCPDHDDQCDRVYEALRRGAEVHTSQITPFRYISIWTPILEEGHDILYLSFSSGMSSTYQNALSAVNTLKEDFPDRTIIAVDSLSATAGQGLLTYTAALNRAKGMSLEENADWLNAHARNLCHRFTVGDLDYLHKGGRVSAATALVGGMLNIKPLMIIDDEGKLQVTAKARGQNAALKNLVRSTKNEYGVEDTPEIIYVTHSSLYDKCEDLVNMLHMVFGDTFRIESVCETPIIGVHTGPEFFAVISFGRHRKES